MSGRTVENHLMKLISCSGHTTTINKLEMGIRIPHKAYIITVIRVGNTLLQAMLFATLHHYCTVHTSA